MTLLIVHAHLDIAARTDIGTNMATDTFIVISIYIATYSVGSHRDPENGIFWTINYTFIAFNAQSTTHAAARLYNYLFFSQPGESFCKVVKNVISGDVAFLSPNHWFFFKISEK